MASQSRVDVGSDDDGNVQTHAFGEQAQRPGVRDAGGELADGVQRGRGDDDRIGGRPRPRAPRVVVADRMSGQLGELRGIDERAASRGAPDTDVPARRLGEPDQGRQVARRASTAGDDVEDASGAYADHLIAGSLRSK